MNRTLKQGDVVNCRHLHDETEPMKVVGPNEKGEYDYRIEGKTRPAVVLGPIHRIWTETIQPPGEKLENGCVLFPATGCQGYLVLTMYSGQRPSHVPSERFPDLVTKGKESYIDLRPVCYPIECLPSDVKEGPLGPFELKLVLDSLQRKGRISRLKWYRA